MFDSVNVSDEATNSTADHMAIRAVSVLDHGFVNLISVMGTDQSIVDSARVSYGQGTRHVRKDRHLIRYLLSHRHTSPFEMCELKFHIAMPIFVARQWIRHRTANVNEISARYSILPDRFYIPESTYLFPQASTNRQGRGEQPLPETLANQYRDKIIKHCQDSYAIYKSLLAEDTDQPGLARELARMVLPTNIYTEWYWKVDLHNLLHFISLRMHPHAQFEIRVYAECIAEMLKELFPITWEAFQDYVINAKNFSSQQLDHLRSIMSDPDTFKGPGPDSMSSREWQQLQDTFVKQR